MKRIRLILVGRSSDIIGYNLVNNLSSIQSEFDFTAHNEIVNLPEGINVRRPVSVEILEALGMKLINDKYPDEYPVVLCGCRLEGDLFSSFDDKVAVITTHGWTKNFSPHPVQSYLAYTLADVIMNQYVSTKIHYESKGCVGDYCDNKKDINIALAECNYCPECRPLILEALQKGSITLSQMAAIYKFLDFAAGRKTCFVLMPFHKKFKPVYTKGIEPAFTNRKWLISRADTVFHSKEIITLTWAEILRSDLVVADMTGSNPNVFYELGYAHALHKHTVLITQSIREVPFDLHHIQVIEYSATPEGYKKLAMALRKLSPL